MVTVRFVLIHTYLIKVMFEARQYGEVVLPDAASGHDPDTLARKLSRCKEGMAWFLQIQVQVLSKPGVSRYKFNRSRETVTVQNVF